MLHSLRYQVVTAEGPRQGPALRLLTSRAGLFGNIMDCNAIWHGFSVVTAAIWRTVPSQERTPVSCIR